jgi:hypothetical protein
MSWVHFFVEGVVLGLVCVFGVAANSIASHILLTSMRGDLGKTNVDKGVVD